MEQTYLIQRLRDPINPSGNPFSFGGGLINGGLSKEVNKLINQIWNFDYMGSAEFEWGAVPNALNKIAHYSSQGKAKTGIVSLPKNTMYLCESGTEKDVESIIQSLYQDKLRLKELSHFRESVNGEKFCDSYKGWLELDNGFMFFIDHNMYKKTLHLFGIDRQK